MTIWYRTGLNRRGRDDQIYWHCALSRGCSGAITTHDDQILAIKDTHNHPVIFFLLVLFASLVTIKWGNHFNLTSVNIHSLSC